MLRFARLEDGEVSTGSSERKGVKFGETSSIKAEWLSMGWPFSQADLRREFQFKRGDNFLLLPLL